MRSDVLARAGVFSGEGQPLKLRTLGVLAVVAVVALAAGEAPARERVRVGAQAPAISVERFLQAPDGVAPDWSSFRGKFVVLDFWATWCGPCVSSVPHMNDIAERFRDRPLQIVVISDEGEDVVKNFVGRKPMKAWIGLDDDSSMFQDYDADKLPRTVIVDPSGKVVAITQPGALTAEGVRRLIDGDDATLSVPDRTQITPVDAPLEEYRPLGAAPAVEARVVQGPPPGPVELPAENTVAAASSSEPSLLQVMIKPSTSSDTSTTLGAGRLKAQALSLADIVAIAYGVKPQQIVMAPSLPNAKYDVEVATPRGRMESLQPLLQQALVATFGLEIRRDKRLTDVYFLSLPVGRPQTISPGSPGERPTISVTPGRLKATSVDMGTLALHLTETLGRMVIDITNLKGKFDIDVEWDAGRPNTIADAFKAKTGLELLSAKSPQDVLLVNPGRVQSASQ